MTGDRPRRIVLRVTPNAKRSEVREEASGDGALVYRVSVTVVPENGKANKEVVKLMAKHLGVPKSHLRIVKGEKGRDKVLEIEN